MFRKHLFHLFLSTYIIVEASVSVGSDTKNTRDVLETLRHFASHSGPDNGDNGDGTRFAVNSRIYNSSVALTIPFFTFKVPHLSAGFIANQAYFGVFSFAITAITFGLSFLFTGSVPSDDQGRSFQSLSTAAKKSSFNFLGSEFSKSFGMDGMQCMQKVVCQCHRKKEARKYGIIAQTVRSIFPAPQNETLSTLKTPLESAAEAGKFETRDCDQLYDCILDPLGSVRYLAHYHDHDNAGILVKLMDYEL